MRVADLTSSVVQETLAAPAMRHAVMTGDAVHVQKNVVGFSAVAERYSLIALITLMIL